MEQEGRENCVSYPQSKSWGTSTQLHDAVLSGFKMQALGCKTKFTQPKLHVTLSTLLPPQPDTSEDPDPYHGEHEPWNTEREYQQYLQPLTLL